MAVQIITSSEFRNNQRYYLNKSKDEGVVYISQMNETKEGKVYIMKENEGLEEFLTRMG